ncbi:MAG: phosphohydrolase [Clostridiales bacterium]|nr:phosphohydrolase [Clostridiales bacterium]
MTQSLLTALATEMVHYYQDDPQHIQHFIKVHSFSRLIAQLEQVDADTCFTLEAAAYVHDIGIKPALAQYHSSAGPYQERLGAPLALEMLTGLGFAPSVAQRVSYLVGHHHTYTDIDGLDYQILVEADFLVNLYEDYPDAAAARRHAADTACQRIFKTAAGTRLCREMFGL